MMINRGTGAGGANTTLNGGKFEEETKTTQKEVNFKNLLIVKGRQLKEVLSKVYKKPLKELIPDEVIIDPDNKRIFILEKKFQNRAGSVDEKIQSGEFKKWKYERMYAPEYSIHYAYVLSDWFKQPCYNDVWEFYQERHPYIKILWGYDDDYKKQLKRWLSKPL